MGVAAKSLALAGNAAVDLVEQTDFYRADAGRRINADERAELGQFLTPPAVSRFMASLSGQCLREVRLLDPGAGVGSLTAAWIDEMLNRRSRPRAIHVTVVEIDSRLSQYLRQTIADCRLACHEKGVAFDAEIIEADFIETAVNWLSPPSLFDSATRAFDCAILNPPYRKINSDSQSRRLLRRAEIETSNLYAAFLWLTLKLLAPQGELVAITPRSFCNGPYFRPLREALLSQSHITRVHLFGSRKNAFRDDDVLQENVIFRAAKPAAPKAKTVISTSRGPDDPDIASRDVAAEELVSPGDPDRVIHLVPDELENQIATRIKSLTSTLPDLDIQVSTGRVVDFRAKEFLVFDHAHLRPNGKTAPLIYPTHFDAGAISWPKDGKKPNYLRITEGTKPLLVPPGVYVLVKRFSAKEEKRRVSAAICRPEGLPKTGFAFENHLNFYHDRGQ